MSKPETYFLYAAYCVLTVVIIFYASYSREIASWVTLVNVELNYYLDFIDGATALGLRLRQIVALALTPIVILAIPTIAYRLIKNKMPPYLIQAVWVLWIIAAVSRLLSQ
ncbi:MAG: hypothetical protein NXI01_05010 [Gammaproteobacteria bacterium]|nr:hypothetical protein [Gammaproteobacteria bacterium]